MIAASAYPILSISLFGPEDEDYGLAINRKEILAARESVQVRLWLVQLHQ